MSNVQWPFLEDIYPEVIEEQFTQKTIDDMIKTMKSLNLQKGSVLYIDYCASIQDAIATFESVDSNNKYEYSDKNLELELDEQDYMDQMKKYNEEQNNVVSISDGSAFKPEVQEERNWVKKIVDKLLQKLKKIS